MPTSWTNTDKKRVRAILSKIAADKGGWQGIADLLKIKAEGKRGTVHAWFTRGRVPIKHIKEVVRLAKECGMDVKFTELNPEAYFLEVAGE